MKHAISMGCNYYQVQEEAAKFNYILPLDFFISLIRSGYERPVVAGRLVYR
jgi:hypothetical protein